MDAAAADQGMLTCADQGVGPALPSSPACNGLAIECDCRITGQGRHPELECDLVACCCLAVLAVCQLSPAQPTATAAPTALPPSGLSLSYRPPAPGSNGPGQFPSTSSSVVAGGRPRHSSTGPRHFGAGRGLGPSAAPGPWPHPPGPLTSDPSSQSSPLQGPVEALEAEPALPPPSALSASPAPSGPASAPGPVPASASDSVVTLSKVEVSLLAIFPG